MDSTNATAKQKQQPDERVVSLWVGPQLVDCVGAAPQKCFEVRYAVDGQIEWFYDTIEGFEHRPGTSYELRVGVSEVANPPADASSQRYRLIEVVQQDSGGSVSDLIGSEWRLKGFRNGDMFDVVPTDITISLAFDDGQISGLAACNRFMAGFVSRGVDISFDAIGSTRMLCPPNVMHYEDRFLAALATIETAELTFDDTLVLAPTEGEALLFDRVL